MNGINFHNQDAIEAYLAEQKKAYRRSCETCVCSIGQFKSALEEDECKKCFRKPGHGMGDRWVGVTQEFINRVEENGACSKAEIEQFRLALAKRRLGDF